MANKIVDAYLIYSLLSRLATPFERWKAYKLKIIDAKGNVLRRRSELTTDEELNAWGRFDIAVANLKKLLAKVPGGSSKFANLAAAAWIFKESKHYTNEQMDTTMVEDFQMFFESIQEEVPTNAVGGGHIAGVGVGPQGEPPMGRNAQLRRLKKILKRRKEYSYKQ
jgi:hypothetical protein